MEHRGVQRNAFAAAPVAAPQYDPRRWWALALLCTAIFVVMVDGSIVFVAAPSIQQDLGLSLNGTQWFLNAYLLSFGGLLLLGGRAADLLGRRRTFMVGVALVTVSSLMCGLAWSAEVLIGARAVQGLSAAIMTPTALSLLMATFPPGPDRNRALGVWSAVGGLGGITGGLLGGPLTDGLGWQWIFFVIVPVGLVILALTPVVLRESHDRGQARSYDVLGALTITAALVLLVYAVVTVPAAGWTHPKALLPLGASVCLLALFVGIEASSSAPLVPLRIFRSRALVGGNLVILAVGMVTQGALGFSISQYAQVVLGYSALEFGLMLTLGAGLSIVGSIAAGSLATRIGVRRVAMTGLVLMGAGCLAMTQISADGSYVRDILLGMALFGPGLGVAFVAASIAALDVAAEESGLAAGINNATFQIGGALGIAFLATVAVSQADGPDPASALTEGLQAAFGVAVVIAGAGLLAALFLLGRRRVAPSGPDGHGVPSGVPGGVPAGVPGAAPGSVGDPAAAPAPVRDLIRD
jgi:EmrB/QacA subfamily drug resistance transporter